MIAGLASWLLARGISERAARPLAWAITIGAAVLVIAGVATLAIRSIYSAGEDAGGAKVTARIERQHRERVAEARTDERAATRAADAIGVGVSRATAVTDTALTTTRSEIHDALASVPPAAAGAAPPAAPVERLHETLNAGIARANRAADAADTTR